LPAGNAPRHAVRAATLENVGNTIDMSGQLGNGQLTLVNDAGGLIENDGSRERHQQCRPAGQSGRPKKVQRRDHCGRRSMQLKLLQLQHYPANPG
jgi:hypothetical protein